MESRMTSETVEFHRPFRLQSQSGLMPAGRYTVQMEEEMVDGLSFAVWRRSNTTICIDQLGRAKRRYVRGRPDCTRSRA